MDQNYLINDKKSRNLKPVKLIGHFKFGDQRKRIAIGRITRSDFPISRKNERIVIRVISSENRPSYLN